MYAFFRSLSLLATEELGYYLQLKISSENKAEKGTDFSVTFQGEQSIRDEQTEKYLEESHAEPAMKARIARKKTLQDNKKTQEDEQMQKYLEEENAREEAERTMRERINAKKLTKTKKVSRIGVEQPADDTKPTLQTKGGKPEVEMKPPPTIESFLGSALLCFKVTHKHGIFNYLL